MCNTTPVVWFNADNESLLIVYSKLCSVLSSKEGKAPCRACTKNTQGNELTESDLCCCIKCFFTSFVRLFLWNFAINKFECKRTELSIRVPYLDSMYNFYRFHLQNKQNVIILWLQVSQRVFSPRRRGDSNLTVFDLSTHPKVMNATSEER